MPWQKQNKNWNNYSERQSLLNTTIAESLVSYFCCMKADKVHASVLRAELTDLSPRHCSSTAEKGQGRGDPKEWDFPWENGGGSSEGSPSKHPGKNCQDFSTHGLSGTHKSGNGGVGLLRRGTIHTILISVMTDAYVQSKMAKELQRYFVLFWGVLGCSRIYVVFHFSLSIFLPELFAGMCFSSFIPSVVSFVGCPHWSRLWTWGQQWKLCLWI